MVEADPNTDKESFVVGAYRDGEGRPVVLSAVAEAARRVMDGNHGHEYLPMTGHAKFCVGATKLLYVRRLCSQCLQPLTFSLVACVGSPGRYGESCTALREGRIASCQSLSGTGALRVGAVFCQRFNPGKPVLISDPTWANHDGIFTDGGLATRKYRYIDAETQTLAIDDMLADVKAAPEGSILLLHACAHNPTGVDPSHEQWERIATVCAERRMIPFFDCAYQGFATGDLEADAFAVRMFAERGLPVMAAQSFSKNCGLYSQRIGNLTVVAASREERERVIGNVARIARTMYSNPPSHGARLVHEILRDPELYKQWKGDCRMMADRIGAMRTALVEELRKQGSTRDWSHITNQIGMFSYTGLTARQCEIMRTRHHVYVLSSGRVSMAAVTPHNVVKLAKAMVDVTEVPANTVPGTADGSDSDERRTVVA